MCSKTEAPDSKFAKQDMHMPIFGNAWWTMMNMHICVRMYSD